MSANAANKSTVTMESTVTVSRPAIRLLAAGLSPQLPALLRCSVMKQLRHVWNVLTISIAPMACTVTVSRPAIWIIPASLVPQFPALLLCRYVMKQVTSVWNVLLITIATMKTTVTNFVNLGAQYAYDYSANIGAFNRIAYYLELDRILNIEIL
jgi:hypothetical protein